MVTQETARRRGVFQDRRVYCDDAAAGGKRPEEGFENGPFALLFAFGLLAVMFVLRYKHKQ
jgi:hypothetical protein